MQQDGWDDLKNSFDVWLDGEQGYVSMVVDMAIVEKWRRWRYFLGMG